MDQDAPGDVERGPVAVHAAPVAAIGALGRPGAVDNEQAGQHEGGHLVAHGPFGTARQLGQLRLGRVHRGRAGLPGVQFGQHVQHVDAMGEPGAPGRLFRHAVGVVPASSGPGRVCWATGY